MSIEDTCRATIPQVKEMIIDALRCHPGGLTKAPLFNEINDRLARKYIYAGGCSYPQMIHALNWMARHDLIVVDSGPGHLGQFTYRLKDKDRLPMVPQWGAPTSRMPGRKLSPMEFTCHVLGGEVRQRIHLPTGAPHEH